MKRQDIEEFKVRSAINRAVRDTSGNLYYYGYMIKDSPFLEHNTILLTDREFNNDYCRFTRDITIDKIEGILREIIDGMASQYQIIIVPMGTERMLLAIKETQRWKL